MEKKEYIEREEAISAIEGDIEGYEWDNCESNLRELPSADVVPWLWLQSYANGKRCNYASDFIIEAKEVWENGTTDILE